MVKCVNIIQIKNLVNLQMLMIIQDVMYLELILLHVTIELKVIVDGIRMNIYVMLIKKIYQH